MSNTTTQTSAPFVFPDGEFSVRELMQASGKTQPYVYLNVKSAIQNNQVKEVRKEIRSASGKGRKTIIYSKV